MTKPTKDIRPPDTKTSCASKEGQSLTDQATQAVRDRILDLTLEPGMNLDERQVLERFSFGRTPMREALNRLIAEGLVVSRGPRGVQVAPLNIASAVELFDAYVVNERVVASMLRFADPGLVADLRDIHATYVKCLNPINLTRVTEVNVLFHNRLAAATQNAFIADHSGKLQMLARRLSYYIYRREAAENGLVGTLFDQPRADHEQIIALIESGDRTGLIEKLTDHAIFFRTRLARIISADRSKDTEFTELATEF